MNSVPCPENVARYLLKKGWRRIEESEHSIIFQRDVEREVYEVYLPLQAEASEYEKHLETLVYEIEIIEECDGSVILRDMLL